MSRQVALRLPDDIVDYLDELVHSGAGASRAAVVTKALERERRREAALRDAAILALKGGYPDLDGLISYTSTYSNPLD